MQLFDIGANLTHSAFSADVAETVERAQQAGVGRIVVTGTTVDETMAAIRIAGEFGLHATAGVHPHHARDCGPQTVPALRELAQHPRGGGPGEEREDVGVVVRLQLARRDHHAAAEHDDPDEPERQEEPADPLAQLLGLERRERRQPLGGERREWDERDEQVAVRAPEVAGRRQDRRQAGQDAGVVADREQQPGDRDAGLFTTVLALANWHGTHTHCSRCGTPTAPTQGGWLRVCPADRSEHYPRTDPAVIMAVVDADERLLLGRGPQWPENRFSVLAGFVEPGESLEAAVAREVEEEVGIDVTDLAYFASQSWAFPHSLMIAYTAHYAGGVLRPDPAEIADARWFGVNALPELPSGVSIARRLIDTTAARLRGEPGTTPVG